MVANVAAPEAVVAVTNSPALFCSAANESLLFLAYPYSTYPIATFTWLLLDKKYDNTQLAEAVKKFVNWGLTDGQKFAEDLGYIPLPKEVVEKDLEALKSVE